MPPVELYKAGEAYFVRDGNHRVSVAKQLGRRTIQALVWEFEGCFPLQPDSDVDSQLCQAAHAAFMDCTHLDRLCPGAGIRLTEPDGYEDLLREIEGYQRILSRIDGHEIPWDEATTLWYEMRYVPILEAIRGRRVLEEFPGRTETDLYLWLCRNLGELEGRYGRRVSIADAADDLAQRSGGRLLPVPSLRKAALWVKGFTQGRVAGWQSLRRKTIRRRTGQPPAKGGRDESDLL
jgi:hypothetical protein